MNKNKTALQASISSKGVLFFCLVAFSIKELIHSDLFTKDILVVELL